ncbi:hypothetical protein AU476_18360 [Cupriavidus sp. UYMSc13B]|nr:hypothetical protein AU476_18360 [Cupriavidus sp. UYMSc13B]
MLFGPLFAAEHLTVARQQHGCLIFLNERFPTSIRATGTGLSWNIGFAIGGMMPTFASLCASTPAELPKVLGMFLATVTIIYLAGAAIVPETAGRLGEK